MTATSVESVLELSRELVRDIFSYTGKFEPGTVELEVPVTNHVFRTCVELVPRDFDERV